MRAAIFLSVVLASCASTSTPAVQCPVDDIRAAIEAEIQNGVRATIEEDIDAYMDGVPDDFRVVEDDGSITDRDALRDFALKSWAIIDETIDLKITLDAIEIAPSCDEAMVRTSQRWERMMQRRDGSGADNVVTTQTHHELWRLKNGRWYNYEITELGGDIFINGEPYTP